MQENSDTIQANYFQGKWNKMTEAIIEGKVDVTNKELCSLLKEHNALIRHQNTILSKILDTLNGA